MLLLAAIPSLWCNPGEMGIDTIEIINYLDVFPHIVRTLVAELSLADSPYLQMFIPSLPPCESILGIDRRWLDDQSRKWKSKYVR
jgi:hypothetical protein